MCQFYDTKNSASLPHVINQNLTRLVAINMSIPKLMVIQPMHRLDCVNFNYDGLLVTQVTVHCHLCYDKTLAVNWSSI